MKARLLLGNLLDDHSSRFYLGLTVLYHVITEKSAASAVRLDEYAGLRLASASH